MADIHAIARANKPEANETPAIVQKDAKLPDPEHELNPDAYKAPAPKIPATPDKPDPLQPDK